MSDTGKSVATWIGLGVTVIVVIVGAAWNGRSYADDKKTEAVAVHTVGLATHAARDEKRDEVQDRKIEKVADAVNAQTAVQAAQNVKLDAIIKRLDRRAR